MSFAVRSCTPYLPSDPPTPMPNLHSSAALFAVSAFRLFPGCLLAIACRPWTGALVLHFGSSQPRRRIRCIPSCVSNRDHYIDFLAENCQYVLQVHLLSGHSRYDRYGRYDRTSESPRVPGSHTPRHLSRCTRSSLAFLRRRFRRSTRACAWQPTTMAVTVAAPPKNQYSMCRQLDRVTLDVKPQC
jgi:hypothetical protein